MKVYDYEHIAASDAHLNLWRHQHQAAITLVTSNVRNCNDAFEAAKHVHIDYIAD